MLLEGIFAAVTTPFYPNERIYFRKLEANIARYSRSLLAGMVVLGSTGEAPLLNDAETRDILRVAADATAPEKVLVAGIGRESLSATVELAEVAGDLHYDVVLVRTPMYYAGQMSMAAVLNYYRSVADRSPLPVLLYNIPKCVPYQMPAELVRELASHPNIIGIKDSSGSVEATSVYVEATRSSPRRIVTVTHIFEAVTARMLAQKPPESGTFVSAASLSGGAAVATAPAIKTRNREVGFQVLSGSASVTLQSLEAGATGAILALAACAPQACCEVYQAWKDHDQKLAEEKQARIAGVNKRIVGELGVSGVKYACDFNGYYGGRPRSPLLTISADERAEIETLLAEIRN